MVKVLSAFVWMVAIQAIGAQDMASDPTAEKKGPVLFGDGSGRLWQWDGGEKTFLTAEGRNLILGGVGEQELWGWSVDRDLARFFTMKLPKKKDSANGKAQAKKNEPLAPVLFDKGTYPAPDLADRVGDRLLLVYGARSGQPRWEFWQAGKQTAARAYDDGRLVYAVALGPQTGWIVAGRTADGAPWLEVSGDTVTVPDGWRGRLTVAAWVEEKKADAAPNSLSPPVPATKDKKKLPPVAHPWAAGWGAPGASDPRALFWGPDGWTQPDPGDPAPMAVGGIYPLLGNPGDGVLTLAGWQADSGTGSIHAWFWDGTGGSVAQSPSDGTPQAFSTKGKGGAFLVVKHQTAPWFTLEQDKDNQPLDGLGPDDRVVAVAPDAAKSSP